MCGPFRQRSRCVNRQTELTGDPPGKFLVSPRVQLVLHYHPVSSSVDQLMHPCSWEHSGSEYRTNPQELAQADLHLEFLVLHITQCVLYFDPVSLTVFFENEIKVVPSVYPRLPCKLSGITSPHHKFGPGET